MISYSEMESKCSLTFSNSGPYWHLWTPENYQVIFPDKDAFIAGMNILAICSRLVPEAKVITFELMSNHLHLALAGLKEAALRLFKLFKICFIFL